MFSKIRKWGAVESDQLLPMLRQSARAVARQRGFSLLVTVTLSVAVAVNAAVLTVVEGVLLRPLPFERPWELVRLLEDDTSGRDKTGQMSPAHFVDVRTLSRGFRGVTAIGWTWGTLLESQTPERLTAMCVTSDFFTVLPAKPILGRPLVGGDFVDIATTPESGDVGTPYRVAVSRRRRCSAKDFGNAVLAALRTWSG